jgi:hypothetical protein
MKKKRTYSDRKECIKKAVAKRRRKLRSMLVEYMGGKCSKCGYNKCQNALDLHHVDPSQKSFGLSSRGLTRSWDRIKVEADKCILLCSNCHREVESMAQETGIEPATG